MATFAGCILQRSRQKRQKLPSSRTRGYIVLGLDPALLTRNTPPVTMRAAHFFWGTIACLEKKTSVREIIGRLDFRAPFQYYLEIPSLRMPPRAPRTAAIKNTTFGGAARPESCFFSICRGNAPRGHAPLVMQYFTISVAILQTGTIQHLKHIEVTCYAWFHFPPNLG